MPEARYRQCYRHPRKPATKDCLGCGRPICRECAEASGDVLLCPPCKERAIEKEIAQAEKRAAEAEKRRERPREEAGEPDRIALLAPHMESRDHLDLGELTIHKDGKVEKPAAPPVVQPPAEKEVKAPDKAPEKEETEAREAGPGKGPKAPGKAIRGLLSRQAKPAAKAAKEAPAEKPSGARPSRVKPPGVAAVKRKATAQVGARPAAEAAGKPGAVRPIKTAAKPGASKPAVKAAEKRKEAGRKKREEKAKKKTLSQRLAERYPDTGPARQLLASLPYGAMAGAAILLVWVLIALIKRRWSQFSVLACGIAVPWALYKGSTIRKRFGSWVWNRPPRTLYLSLLSVGTMAVLVPVFEYVAFLLIFRGSDLKSPLTEFLKLNFNVVGIILVVAGFAIAFFVPYLLRTGEGRGEPAPEQKKKSENGD